MKREVIITEDGSSTIYLPEWEEHYHSRHGAVQETKHVFIEAGFRQMIDKKKINILEIGFGTGLNCLLTCKEALKTDIKVEYTGVEAYPVKPEEIVTLNYCKLIDWLPAEEVFRKMHALPWEESNPLTSEVSLTKRKQFFEDIEDSDCFDLIYFDAFGARVQPALWEEPILKKMYNALKKNGILVTYSAKGSVRRTLQELGFRVARLQGPPGKRHMVRAIKL